LRVEQRFKGGESTKLAAVLGNPAAIRL